MEQTLIDEVATGPQADKSLHKPVIKRTDLITAAIVEEGLMLLSTHGFEQASEYLSAKMVPLRVVRRVLLSPSERRKPEAKKKR